MYNLIPRTLTNNHSSHFVNSQDLETRNGLIKKWEDIEALTDRSERAKQLNDEISRIAKLFAEGNETVQMTPLKYDNETGLLKMISSSKAHNRLINWLNLKYPTATPIKKDWKPAPAKKKPISCPHCSKEFTSQGALKYHVEKKICQDPEEVELNEEGKFSSAIKSNLIPNNKQSLIFLRLEEKGCISQDVERNVIVRKESTTYPRGD